MNAKKRVKMAMCFQKPDRVTIWCQLSEEHIIRNTDVDSDSYYFTNEGRARALLEVQRLYNFDGILVCGSNPEIIKDKKETIEEFNLQRWEKIQEREFSERWIKNYLPFKVYDILQSKVGDKVHISGWVPAPLAASLCCFESLERGLTFMVDYPEIIKKMMRHFAKLAIEVIHIQSEVGIDSVHISDPYSGSSFISPQFYQDFVLPLIQRITFALKDENIFTYLHTCGFINDRLELMAKIGVDGIECMDPPPLGDVELSEAKRRIGNKLFLKGNIDPVNILYSGSEEEIVNAVRENISAGAANGGYILSTACSVSPDTPKEKVKLLVETGIKYGKDKT